MDHIFTDVEFLDSFFNQKNNTDIIWYINFRFRKKIFKSYSAHLAIIFLGLLIATGLASTYHTNLTISTVGSFFIAAEVIILIYLILPFPIAVNFCVAIMFSIVFEVSSFWSRIVPNLSLCCWWKNLQNWLFSFERFFILVCPQMDLVLFYHL